jgi:oxygen-dependent protoporphyrinogen oxidase
VKSDRIIIGAGLSGLLAARRGCLAGESVVILEASEHIGGALSSLMIDGVEVDAGAEAFSTVSPAFFEFLESVGLADSVEYPEPLPPRIVSASGAYPLPRGVMGVPADLDGLDIAGVVSSEGLALAKKLDAMPIPAQWSQWSVSELIRNRLGEEFLRRLVEPLILGVHSSAAESVSAQLVFGDLMARAETTGSLVSAARELRGAGPSMGSAVATLSGGLHKVTQALASSVVNLGATIDVSTKVLSLSSRGGLWSAVTAGQTYVAPQVTIATGPSAARSLTTTITPVNRALQPFSSVPSAIVTLSLDSKTLSQWPLGPGALLAPDLGLETKATTHVNSKWKWLRAHMPEDRHVIRFSFGRDGVIPPGSLTEHALVGLERIYGVARSAVRAAVETTWPDTLVRPGLGYSDAVNRAREVSTENGISLEGAYLSGNGVLGLVTSAHPTMKGTSRVH